MKCLRVIKIHKLFVFYIFVRVNEIFLKGSSNSVTITQSMTRTTDTSLTSLNAITDSSSVMITQRTIHTTDERLTSNNTTTVLDTTMSLLTTPETACCCWGREKPAETKEELSKMFIPRTETSRYKRSKTSAPDERKSSKVIASVAVVTMAVPIVLIVTADLISFLQSPFIKKLKCLGSKTQTHLEVRNDVNKI